MNPLHILPDQYLKATNRKINQKIKLSVLGYFKDPFVLDKPFLQNLIKVPNWAKNKPIGCVLEANVISVAVVTCYCLNLLGKVKYSHTDIVFYI